MGGIKTKKQQPKDDSSGRNNFQTPLYALELIIPFIPKTVKTILEPSAGQMRLVDSLRNKHGYKVLASDLYPQRKDCFKMDFIEMQKDSYTEGIDCIITNPPFSLKFDFISKAMELDIPFAFLIPFDMCGFLHDKFKGGLQAIIPNRRIDYLTPNIVERINIGETLFGINKGLEKEKKYKKMEDVPAFIWNKAVKVRFTKIDEVPVSIIKKYSSSDFHSFWITGGFNQKNQNEYVELSIEDKKNVV